MAAGSTYTPIATTTLGSATSSYTFSSIPSTYTDLVLVGAFATDNPSSINLNVGAGSIDTGSNFSWTYLLGNGTSASSSRGSTDTRIFAGATNSSNGQSNIIISFNNYSNTTTNKTTLNRFNDTTSGTYATVGLWRNTAAINQIRLLANGNNLAAGSTFTLYGIAAA
jgi:hypothetical protein